MLARSRLVERDRRRVLIVLENAPMPTDRRVRQEAVALRDGGYEVTVISPQGTTVDSEAFELYEGIDVYRFPIEMAERAIGYVREYGNAMWRIRSLVGRLTSDRSFGVIHACNPPDFLIGIGWPLRRRGTRLVFDHHDLSPELYESRYGRRGAPYAALRAAERFAFGVADMVVTTNESYRSVAVERGHKPADRVFVVRNAPDTAEFHRVAPDESLKRGRPFLIAYLGLMGPQDGLDAAIRALALLRAGREDWRAVFMGDGEIFEETRALAGDLGLADFIEFTGRVKEDRILPTLSAADVCISPEPSNPLNDRSTFVKVMEYMAIGIPIVAFDLPETRVSARDAALYAPPGDEAAFADCIASLFDDPDRRLAMGTHGRKRIAGEIGWDRSRAELLRAYATLVSA